MPKIAHEFWRTSILTKDLYEKRQELAGSSAAVVFENKTQTTFLIQQSWRASWVTPVLRGTLAARGLIAGGTARE